jgi:hypothetical protein
MLKNSISLKLLLLSIIVLNGCLDSGDSNIGVVYEEKKLNIGKQPGTFLFIFKVNFRDNVKLDFPVDVHIRKGSIYGDVLYTRRVETVRKITISFELPPGNYSITSSPVEDIHRKEFWDGIGPGFEIDESGLLKYSTVDIFYQKRIKVNYPQGTLTIPGNKSSLKLEWVPLKDSVSYDVYWSITSNASSKFIKEFKRYGIEESFFEFRFDLNEKYFTEEKCDIMWMLFAQNESGVPIGYASNLFTVKIEKR